ncbi:MAG: hypothetical protein QY309_03065 [Cyclobacteriaceae bacterium]|nr:MAG: hypothetical protein QY309_03065 [Cyclobacteriaceae bacterium]
MSTSTKPPVWFWIVAVVALLWNALGIMAYLMRAYMTDEALAALPQEQQVYLQNQPAWYIGVFALAVFGGTLGSLLLLLRKALAYWIFVVSLICVVAQWSYDLFMVENSPAFESSGMAMAVMIPLFSVALVFISRTAKSKGWIG